MNLKFFGLQHLENFQLKSTLIKGRPLLARQVRRIPVVFRGDVVDAVYRSGLLRITIKVQAMEDGAEGDSVRVRNLDSKNELRGIVRNENAIEIELF